MAGELEGLASPTPKPATGHDREPAAYWRTVLFCSTAFKASSHSNSCDLIDTRKDSWNWEIALASTYTGGGGGGGGGDEEKQHKSTAWVELKTHNPAPKRSNGLREDPILQHVIYLCGVQPMKKSTHKGQEQKMNWNILLEILLHCSPWLLQEQCWACVFYAAAVYKILSPVLKSDI
jgi:hypothetical protein